MSRRMAQAATTVDALGSGAKVSIDLYFGPVTLAGEIDSIERDTFGTPNAVRLIDSRMYPVLIRVCDMHAIYPA